MAEKLELRAELSLGIGGSLAVHDELVRAFRKTPFGDGQAGHVRVGAESGVFLELHAFDDLEADTASTRPHVAGHRSRRRDSGHLGDGFRIRDRKR